MEPRDRESMVRDMLLCRENSEIWCFCEWLEVIRIMEHFCVEKGGETSNAGINTGDEGDAMAKLAKVFCVCFSMLSVQGSPRL